MRSAHFKNVSRVTMMPVVFADGSCGRTLFVVQGRRVPYRVIEVNEVLSTQSLADCLPTGSYIRTREDLAGVDKFSFERWAADFGIECKSLTALGQKVLLLYDGYRSHMSLKALEILKANNIIAYALPSHTSATAQPLDVSVFNSFKHFLRKSIKAATKSVDSTEYDLFDLCIFIRDAYERSFTRENILSSFSRTGVNPMGSGDLLCVPRPISKDEPSKMVSVADLANLLEEKRATVRKCMLLQVPVLHKGYVDTSSGLNLTSNTAMEMVRRKEVNEKAKRARENLKRNTQEQRQLTIYETKRRRRLQLELDALYSRVRLYNDPFKLPRSMKERRLAARQRAQEKRVASLNGTRRERG